MVENLLESFVKKEIQKKQVEFKIRSNKNKMW